MGLESYGMADRGDGDMQELSYWRKHSALEGYMHILWREKDNHQTFNKEKLYLSSQDIDDLEVAVKGNRLPKSHGFFWGEDSRHNKELKATTIQFIEDARDALRAGHKVVYTSWW